MGSPQESYLLTLAQEAGIEVDPESMTKAEDSQAIEELKESTGRQQPLRRLVLGGTMCAWSTR